MHKRLIQSIVNMRANYPTIRIIIKKDDFKSAYQRQDLSALAAIQSATKINWKGTLYAIISLRLAFGGANGPAKLSTISKPIADLGNALSWTTLGNYKKPKRQTNTRSPHHQPRTYPSCLPRVNPWQST